MVATLCGHILWKVMLMKLFSTLSETFVSDMFPEKGDEITVRLVSDCLLERALLRYDSYTGLSRDCEMRCLGWRDNAYFYEAELPIFTADDKLSYYFIVVKGGKTFYYSKSGIKKTVPSFSHRFIIIPSLDAPSWITDATCYQIFPDRFCNGDPSNDVKDGEYEFDGALVQAKAFDSIPEEFNKARCLDFYNGDLKGIEDKLDYLKKLGVSLIYLNPIFSSMTVHRYDSTDFFNIDKKLGGNEALISLIRKAHEMDIRIMMDISINHVGTASAWYEKAQKGDEECSSYFTREKDGSIKYWNDVSTLADLDYSSEALRDIIYRSSESAMQKFLKPPFSIDAWRLDVAPEVARTEDKSLCLEVWREARKALKAVKRDLYIVGEGWDDSRIYLDGDAWDSTMNYFGSSRPLRNLVGEEDRFLNPGWGFPPKERERIGAHDFVDAVNSYLEGNNDQMVYFMMNLIDSHDTPRLYNHEIATDDRLLSLSLILYMLPGFPSLYYGDEIKLDGRISSMEGARYPMCWDEKRWNRKYLERYASLGEIRKKQGFGKSAFLMEALDDETISIRRFLPSETLVAVINLSTEEKSLDLDPFMLKGECGSLLLGDGNVRYLNISVKSGSSALFSFTSY